MVKGNGYGHGSLGLSSILDRLHLVDALGVASLREATELRLSGVRLPISVFTPCFGVFPDILKHYLIPAIHTFDSLFAFEQAAKKLKRTKAPFHLALDSGMHRVGFEPAQIPELIKSLKGCSAIAPISVFSHLATADDVQHDSFTHSQIDLFELMSRQICDALPDPVMRHILNSAGTERFPSAQFDMVRIGIGMYGVSAIDSSLLRHPSTLHCPIIQIKDIPFGETVGYGRHGKTLDGAKRIATLPIGYADGVDRRLSQGKGRFLVHGVLAPTIGNICMDMCMIDIGDTPAAVGDTVTLFGGNVVTPSVSNAVTPSVSNAVTPSVSNAVTPCVRNAVTPCGNAPAPTAIEWANTLGTIPYEIYTSIARRVERVYS